MSITLKLKDGSSLECSSAIGQKKFISGCTRDCITFYFDKASYSSEDLYNIFNDSTKTSEITIVNNATESEETEEFIHYDYSILDSIAVTQEVVTKETNESPEVTKTMISVCMGQKTYTEKNIDSKNQQIDDVCELIADMLGGAE